MERVLEEVFSSTTASRHQSKVGLLGAVVRGAHDVTETSVAFRHRGCSYYGKEVSDRNSRMEDKIVASLSTAGARMRPGFGQGDLVTSMSKVTVG